MSKPAAAKKVEVDLLDLPRHEAVAPDAKALQIGSLTFDEISKANRAAQVGYYSFKG